MKEIAVGQCDHKTEEEYGVCNRCKAFARIARDAKAFLEARKTCLDALLLEPEKVGSLRDAVGERLRRLEDSVGFAEQAKLWD